MEETDISGSIVLKHVSYAYDSEEGTVLRDVEMEIPAGTSVGIIGPSGAGKTTLLDIWLYRREKKSLDEDYIAAELEKLGLPGFERRCRSISGRLFGWPQSAEALTGEERKTLFWMEESGVYGTAEHHVKRKLQEIRQSGAAHDGEAKRKYLLRRLFPQLSWYQANAPFCYRHRWAIPFYWAGWIVRSIFVRRKEIQRELSVLWRADDGAE